MKVEDFPEKNKTIDIRTLESGNVVSKLFSFKLQIRIFFFNIDLLFFFHLLITAPGRVSRFTVTQDPNVTAETNVHIEWSPPVKRDLNGVIQTYFIKYWYQPNKETVKLIFLSFTYLN